MSYDIDIHVKTVDGVRINVYSSNITYNVRPMLEAAGLCRSLNDFDGKTCLELIGAFGEARRRIHSGGAPEDIGQFEAKNGWGTFEQLIPWFDEFYQAVILHLSGVIRVS